MTAKTLLLASIMTVSLVACAKKDDAAGTKMDSTATSTTTTTTEPTPTVVNDTNTTAVDVNANPTVSPNSKDTAVVQDKAKNDSLINKSDSANMKK
jgi:hypothetical protein